MGFYYISIFSIVPLGIAYGLLALVYWGVMRGTRAMPGRMAILSLVGVIFLILPIGEELWIAWNFGQACKEAGTFIHKKVQVEGFYDATMRSAYENTKPGQFRFVEQATADGEAFERVERVDDESRSKAIAWYAERNPGKSLPKTIVNPLNDTVQIVVSVSDGETWHVTKLDRPTARYWYARDSGKKIAHKVGRQQSTVVDKPANEAIALYTEIYREAPWYFIGLGSTNKVCATRESERIYKNGFLIYRDVLLPIGSTSEGRK